LSRKAGKCWKKTNKQGASIRQYLTKKLGF